RPQDSGQRRARLARVRPVQYHGGVPLRGTMNPYVRVVAAQVLFVFVSAGATAQTTPESGGLWSDLTVPGIPDGFAKTASLNLDTLGPTRLMLEFVRVHGLPEASGGNRFGRVEK